MPHSRPDARPWVATQVRWLKPKTVLDVGAGAGTYWNALHHLVDAHWTAIDIHGPYVETYNLDLMYDEVIVGDFLAYPFVVGSFDLVLLGDVLEHVPENSAPTMLAKARALGRVIAVVPIDGYEQGSVGGNEHEAHLWHPTHEGMLGLEPVASWSNRRKGAYLW